MRVIDGHVFLGETIYVSQGPEDLIAKMNQVGIEVSVIVAPPPGPFYEEANKVVREAVQRYPGRLAALYRVNPHLEGEVERTREALEERVFVGLHLDPTNDGYGVGSQVVEPVIKVAGEMGVPVYVHSGDSIFCPPEAVADLASKFVNVNFITPMSRRAPRAVQDRGNLYLTTRPFPTLAFQRGYAENLDPSRLIFATDSPLGSPEIEMRRVELAGLDADVKEKVLGGNLQRIMGL
ncbi:hypothetical protein DRO42_01965 [Candidatus Bathyarchaeota archaeon]|nr:MAG: hypothetical protein DRO42_01965 [Candidatus Bathyarchaeota archaeon]